MSRAAVSIFAFAIYLFVLGTVLLVDPNFLLGMFRFEPTTEVHIRIVGMLVFVLGYYYLRAARSEMTEFIRLTVHGRASVIVFFSAFVVLGLAKPQLILFGVVDLACAAWTFLALRADTAAAPVRT